MKKGMLFIAAVMLSVSSLAQVARGFNYQAVARDAAGDPLAGTDLSVRISLYSGSTLEWQEDHSVRTSELGLFSLVVGSESATRTGGAIAAFDEIPWSKGSFSMEVSIDRGSGFSSMGSSPLMPVPYALYALNGADGTAMGWLSNIDTLYTQNSVAIGTDTPNASLLAIQAKDPQVEKPLFEVRNDNGVPVFAVYNDGVIVYVDQAKKGNKGGFAVGGYNSVSKSFGQEYLRITPDSVRIWVPETTASGGSIAGFAVGGFSQGSAAKQNFLEVNSTNTSIYFDTTAAAKGVKGGFAVGGYNASTKGTSDQLMSLTRDNYLIGQDAGSNITTGKNNTFFGWQAGLNNTSGSENIFIGKLAGTSNLDAVENIFIGNQSGFSTVYGYGNVYMGNQSGYSNLNGYFNSIIGYQAGYNLLSHYNTFLGFQSGYNVTSGLNNIALGFRAGYGYPLDGEGVTGDDNIFMGYNSGFNTTTGSRNIFMGTITGYTNTTGSDNIFLGDNSGAWNSVGNYNVYMGYQAGYSGGYDTEEDPSYNTMIGYKAGYGNQTGGWLTMIGSRAGLVSKGGFNTFLGVEAGYSAGNGHHNTYVGIATGANNEGSDNVFVGAFAGYYGGEGGINNVLIGNSAGQGSGPGAQFSYNTYVGKSAGVYTSTGSGNTYLGYQAGFSTSTGSGNVFLGYEAGYNETGNNKLYIANSGTASPLVYGDFSSGQFTITGNAGINYPGTYGYGLVINTPASQAQQFALYTFGSAYLSGSLYQGSDRAFKKDMHPVSDAVAKLSTLNGVYFRYDETAKGVNTAEEESIGVIAQEVEQVFPSLVRENQDGLKAVNYTALIPVLIEAIKEQQQQIDAQQAEIEKLKAAFESR